MAQSTWTGAISSDWNDPNNWSPAGVPNGPLAPVTILPAPNQPILNSNVEVRNITAGAGTALNLNGYTLRINLQVGFTSMTLSNGTLEDVAGVSGHINLTSCTVYNMVFIKKGTGNFLTYGNCMFNGPTVFDVKSTASGLFSLGVDAPHSFMSDVEFRNQSSSVNMSIAETGPNTFKNIFIENTGNTTITFGKTFPFATIAITGGIDGSGISNGTIDLKGITQFENIANDLGFPVNLMVVNSAFSGDFTCLAQNSIKLSNSFFAGNNLFTGANISDLQNNTIGAPGKTSTIHKIATPLSGNNTWFGLNVIHNTTFINESNADIRMSGSVGDMYKGNTVFNNTGGGLMEIAYTGMSTFSGDVTLNNSSAKGINLGPPASTSATINGNLKTTTGFSNGPLNLYRLEQMATTPNGSFTPTSFTATNTRLHGAFSCVTSGNMTLTGSVFNRNNTLTALNFSQIVQCTFSDKGGSTTITKTGGTNNNWTGNNTFGNVTIINQSDKSIEMANSPSSPDRFEGRAEFQQTNAAGAITPCQNSDCYFMGDISTTGSVNSVLFGGNNSGTVRIEGDNSQFLLGPVATPPAFRRLIMNTNGTLTLNVPLHIQAQANLTKGVIISSSTNPLVIESGATVSGGSTASHVDGPMRRISTANSAFLFPVGDNGKYAPVTINPSSTFGAFEVQYLYSDPAPAFSGVDGTLDHVSTCEYWTINRLGMGTGNVQLTFTWDDVRSCGVNDLTALRMARWNGAAWTNTNSVVLGSLPSGAILINNINTFGAFTLASTTAANPLPIELLYFTAKPNGEVVDLSWATATEKDNDFFTVERSRDGVRFDPVLRVPGAGTSTARIDYFEVDPRPLAGTSYYRLRQTDYDGTSTLSTVVAVQMPVRANDFKVYPNPAEGFFFLDTGIESTEIHWRLVGSLGQDVPVRPQLQAGRMMFSTHGLAPGVYFLELRYGNSVQTVKVFVR